MNIVALTRSNIDIALALAAVILATRFGGEFGFPPSGISTFWPPNAILLAALLMIRDTRRTACLLLAYPAYFIAELWTGFDIQSLLIFAMANCLEVLVALTLIQRFSKPPFDLTCLRQLMILLIAVGFASPIGGFVGASGVALSGGPFGATFVRWVRADFVGFLVFVPLVLTLPAWRDWLVSTRPLAKVEAFLGVTALLVVSIAAYGPWNVWGLYFHGGQFLPIPIMLWMALRFGPKGAAVASLMVSLIALSYAIHGFGPFSDLTPETNVASLQVFVISLILATLTVAVLLHERDVALSDLAQARDDLEIRVEERTNEFLDSQGRYQTLVEAAPICIHEIDLDGRLTSMNAAGLKMMSVDDEAQICGLDYLSIPELEHRGKVRRLFSDAIEGKPSEFEFYVNSEKGPVHFESCFVPIRDRSGDVTKIIGVTQDVTERKKTEAALRHSQKTEAIGQLTGGVAHDFNNLLAVILGNADLLELEFSTTKEASENIDAIRNSVARGASLTERLLAFARKTALQPVAADIAEIIEGLRDMLQRTLGASIALQIKMTPDLWYGTIDPHQFEDALLNLAINARDAMLQGGDLTIEAANVSVTEDEARELGDLAAGDYVKVTVIDTGKGIPADNLKKVIDPFFTTKEVGKGSGLGLSMVYGFVLQSKGHFEIDSEVGVGTTVVLYLPRAIGGVSEKHPEDSDTYIAHSSKRILVVEDDSDVRRVCVSVLRHQGFNVTEASDGDEAISALSSGPEFDLLFTDIILPGGKNGADIAAMAIAMHSNIKVVYTTGHAELSSIENLTLDPDAIRINKPYPRKELLEKISSALA